MDDRHKKQAYQLASIGHWEVDVVNNQLYWSDQIKRLHEVPLDYNPTLETAISFYAEGSPRKKVREIVTQAIEKGESFSFESKIITAKGNSRWVRALGETEMKDGQCIYVYGSTQDITDQREAEIEIQKVNQKLQDIVEHSTIMYYRHDTDHNITYVSPQSTRFLGCPPKQAMQKWTDFLTDHEKNRQGIKATEKAIKTGNPQPPYEQQLQRTDGKKIWVQVNESPVVENGETVEIVGSMTDITDLKEKQQQLKDKETQLRNIANNIDGMIMRYVLHPDGSDANPYVSDGVRDLFELPPEVVLESTEPVWAQFDEDHIDAVQQSVQKSAKTLKNWDKRWKIETPSGEEKWIHGRGTPKKLEDGVVLWDTILLDITDQHELEQNIKQQVNLLNHILDSLPGLFYMLDADGNYVRVNNNTEDFFGKSAEQLKGTNALLNVPPRKRDEAKQSIQQVFNQGYADLDTILIDGDGQEHHYHTNGSYVELNGRDYLIGNAIDITDRLKAEKENIVLLQEIHHRVKNNLAIISGILSLELDELPAKSQNRSALEHSVNRIQAIAKVHELLYQSSDLSKIKVKNYVSELVNTVIETLDIGKDFDIHFEIDEVEMNLNDITPLGILLNELLTNSFKYAFQDRQDGLITLDIKQQNEAYNIKYRDNGPGFEQSIFEKSETMGFTIIKVLLQQLDANYSIDPKNGFKINFTFEKRESGSHANI